MTIEDAIRKANELGATVVNGINWLHAENFPTPEAGQEFVRLLDRHGRDNRGYCPAMPGVSNKNLHVDSVNFR